MEGDDETPNSPGDQSSQYLTYRDKDPAHLEMRDTKRKTIKKNDDGDMSSSYEEDGEAGIFPPKHN